MPFYFFDSLAEEGGILLLTYNVQIRTVRHNPFSAGSTSCSLMAVSPGLSSLCSLLFLSLLRLTAATLRPTVDCQCRSPLSRPAFRPASPRDLNSLSCHHVPYCLIYPSSYQCYWNNGVRISQAKNSKLNNFFFANTKQDSRTPCYQQIENL